MAKKLIIIMVNTDPRNGEELGAPFFQATVAAAMDYEVEVVCTATAGQLMKKGVAEKLFVKPGSPKICLRFHQGCARRRREILLLFAQPRPFRHDRSETLFPNAKASSVAPRSSKRSWRTMKRAS